MAPSEMFNKTRDILEPFGYFGYFLDMCRKSELTSGTALF